MRRVIWGIVLSAIFCVPAFSSGWWIHYEDCLLYLDRLHNEPLPEPRGDATLIENNLSYFAVGCWLPDIERGLFDLPWDFSHNQDFLWFMYQKAIEQMGDDPWKVALAAGNIHHSSTDMVAQVLSCSYFACKAGFGLLDVFPGFYDDHAGGENELFFEAGMDVLFGDYTVIAQHIINVLSDQATFQKFWAFVQGCIDEYAATKVRLKADPYETFRQIADLAQKNDLTSKLELYSTYAIDDLKDMLEIPTEIDIYELLRALFSPAIFDPNFYDEHFEYAEGFHWLGTQIAREMEPGSNWFDVWPTWYATTFLSGGAQGLAPHVDSMTPNCTQLLWSARFTDVDGNTVNSLSPQSWPEQLVLKLSMINVLPDTKTITVRVKAYNGGLDWQNDPVIAENSFVIDDSPKDYGSNPGTSFELLFDMPEPTDVYGIYFELYYNDAAKPYLVSLPLAFYAMDTVDPFKAQYQNVLFCDTCFPPHPVVTDPMTDLDYGWLFGRVFDRLSEKPIKYATVTYEKSEQLTTTRFGYFQVDNLAPQNIEISAAAADYFSGSQSVNIEEGKGIWATIKLDPKIIVTDEGEYTSNNVLIFVSFEPLNKFKGLTGYSAGAGSSPDAADIVPFTSISFDTYTNLLFPQTPKDGAKVYVLIRPDVEAVVTKPSSSDGITIDASPPEIKKINVIDTKKKKEFSVDFSVEVEEPHSKITSVEACLGSREGLCDQTRPTQINPARANLSIPIVPKDSVFLNVWAINAAALKSKVASRKVKSEKEKTNAQEGCGWF